MGRVMSVLLLVIAWRPSVVNELPVAAQPRIQFILKETVVTVLGKYVAQGDFRSDDQKVEVTVS